MIKLGLSNLLFLFFILHGRVRVRVRVRRTMMVILSFVIVIIRSWCTGRMMTFIYLDKTIEGIVVWYHYSNCIVMCRRLLRSVDKDYFYYPSHYQFGTFVATDDDDDNVAVASNFSISIVFRTRNETRTRTITFRRGQRWRVGDFTNR